MALSLISLVPGDSITRTVVCLKSDNSTTVKAALNPAESQLPLITDSTVTEYIGHRFDHLMKLSTKSSA